MKFEASNWKLRVCSCGRWCKHFIWDMQLLCQLRWGYLSFQGQSETLLLNQKRKRGRLKNNTTAFIRQPSEAYFQKRIAFHASSAVRKTNSYLEYILL